MNHLFRLKEFRGGEKNETNSLSILVGEIFEFDFVSCILKYEYPLLYQ